MSLFYQQYKICNFLKWKKLDNVIFTVYKVLYHLRPISDHVKDFKKLKK